GGAETASASRARAPDGDDRDCVPGSTHRAHEEPPKPCPDPTPGGSGRPGWVARYTCSSRPAPAMPDLRQSCRDVLGMRGGVLDFPQPRVAVRRIVNDEVF